MQKAPSPQDWTALKQAAAALLAAGVTGRVRPFLRAVRELKAAALMLLFALAGSLGITPPQCSGRADRSSATGRIPVAPKTRNRPDWRNPSVSVCAFADDDPVSSRTINQGAGIVRPRTGHKPTPATASIDKALKTLAGVVALCAAPSAHARRLARAIAAKPKVIISTAAVKAFSVSRRAQIRKDREAAKWIQRSWRGRRRRKETG